MLTIRQRISDELWLLEKDHRLRTLCPSVGHDFCSNDYLGLARHEKIAQAATSALTQGYGATSSRFIRGEYAAYQLLEEKLADFSGFKASLIFSCGYTANVGALPALIKKGDVVFSDRLNHASIIDGLRLSGAQVIIFEHLDLDDLKTKILEHKSPARFLVTESLFSMDGDCAPLDKYAKLAKEHDLALIIDEAHAVGLYGRKGAGLIDHFGIHDQVLLSINGLGKAFGCYGAFLAASTEVIQYLRQKARTLMYSTALPPVAIAAIDQALELVQNGDDLRHKLFSNIELVSRELSLKTCELFSPIIPLVVGPSEKALHLSKQLKESGFDIKAIRPPTVAQGTARLRLSIHASHTQELLLKLCETLQELL